MVGFGQQRIFGAAGKEHPSPPLPSPAVGEVLKLDSIAVSVFADILIELTNTEYQYQTARSKKLF